MSSQQMPCVLSHFQAEAIISGREQNKTSVTTSLDLGLTTADVRLHPDCVTLPDNQNLSWSQIEEIHGNELACYHLTNSQIEKIRFFSESQNRYYSLMPTRSAPTMLISGIPMHRIKGTDPHRDTLSKLRAVAPVNGRVLDTTMGLGYTAIEAARSAEEVITIELDATVEKICRRNPWSQGLFHSTKITRLIGDAFDEIQQLETEEFSRIIHDPPMFSLAGDLYSADFYRQLARVLKRRGKLFHYIGDPESKSGRNVTRGVVRRLREVGFRKVTPRPQAFGVVAQK